MKDVAIPEEIPARHMPRSRSTTLIFAGLFAVGLVAFLVLLAVDSHRAWQAYVANWLFVTSVAIGAIMVGAATTIARARWNWSLRRISMAFGAFLPISFILFLPMLTLGDNYFPWIEYMEFDEIVQKKEAYLNLPFLTARNVAGLLLLFGVALYFVYLSVRPDLGEAPPPEEDDDGRRTWRERLTGGWMGQEKEALTAWTRMRAVAPALVLIYALVMSVISVDWAMSLEPHWFSMLFPGWFFMGAFLAGLAVTGLTTMFLRRSPGSYLQEAVGPDQLHDLGKLTFGFSIFWMYLVFSQYIVIWYGKLPWEQEWIIHRSMDGWGVFSVVTIALCFFVPFAVLLGKRPKLNPQILGSVGGIILLGLWLERYLLIAPSIREEGTPHMTLWEPAIALLFIAPLVLSVRWFLSTFPMVQLWQPPPPEEAVEAEIPPEELERLRSERAAEQPQG